MQVSVYFPVLLKRYSLCGDDVLYFTARVAIGEFNECINSREPYQLQNHSEVEKKTIGLTFLL